MKQNKKPIIALLGNLKIAFLSILLFSFSQAWAISSDFGIGAALTPYVAIVKGIVLTIIAIAVLIFGVQIAMSFMSESDQPTPKKKLIGFFVGIIVFFIIYNLNIV